MPLQQRARHRQVLPMTRGTSHGKPAMKIRVIDTVQGLITLQGFWDAVLEKSENASPFQTFEWLVSWWTTFGKDRRLFVLTAEDDQGNPCGVAPFMIETTAGLKILKFIGTGRSDYLNFLMKGNIDDTLAAFISFLNDHNGQWDIIFLSDILNDDGSVARILREAGTAGWGVRTRSYYECPYLPTTGSWQQFLSSKSANFRYSLKRKEDVIKKKNLQFRIAFSNSRRLAPWLFKDMVEIERHSWKFKNGNLNMQDQASQQFFMNYLGQFAKKEWMNLWLAYLEGRPAAYLINFDYQGKIWFYNAAYTERDGRYATGSLLMSRAIQDAFARGKKEYDFMRGVEAYKERWTPLKRQSFQVALYKKSFRSISGFHILVRLRWFLARFESAHSIRLYFIKKARKSRKPGA